LQILPSEERVDSFIDPRIALVKFEPQRYTLALIGLKMNGLNGFELYERIFGKDRSVKICFMSAYDYSAYPEFQKNHIEIPVEFYLKKLLNIEEFLSIINKLTSQDPRR
jgi:two-component SAPR family response regulator